MGLGLEGPGPKSFWASMSAAVPPARTTSRPRLTSSASIPSGRLWLVPIKMSPRRRSGDLMA